MNDPNITPIADSRTQSTNGLPRDYQWLNTAPNSYYRRMLEEEQKSSPDSPSVEEFLAEENRQLRKAGCNLAEAAIHAAKEHDGVHRLMLAVSEWAMAIANEGGRGKANSKIADQNSPSSSSS